MADVENHIKGLTSTQKDVWVRVANSALKRCLANGKSQEACEGSAIRQANAVAKEVKESMEIETEINRMQSSINELKRLLESGRMLSAATQNAINAVMKALQNLLDTANKQTGDDDDDVEEATKTEDGKAFPASDYAYVPDSDKPSTWKLRLTATPGGGPDSGIVGAACAALGKGFRGQKVEIPAADLPKVKAKVRAAWRKANPDKDPDEMPPVIREAEDMDLIGDFVPLVEKSMGKDGTVPLRIIAPGWGASGYYPAKVLERDGPEVFLKDTKMFWNHPTVTEEAERPERDLRDLAARLLTDAKWEAGGPAGPGLYAQAEVFSPYRAAVEELAPHIGVSIRALGKASQGEAEGKKGPVVEQITTAKSVDFVTTPGAGGQILQLFEAAGRRQLNREEDQVTEEEAKELREGNEALKAENARLKEGLLLREARDVASEELAKIDMPDLTRTRLLDGLAKSPPVKDGELDREALATHIQEAARVELEYLVKLTGGPIKGMGSGGGNGGAEQLKDSFKHMYIRQGRTAEEAEKLAAMAAER